MKKVLSLVLCFVLVAVMALPALAADYTIGDDGNAVYDNAHGYVFGVDSVNGTVNETVVVLNSQEAFDACASVWSIYILLNKVEENVYVAAEDAFVAKGSKPAYTLGEGDIVLVSHSSSSRPTDAETYPNWQDKIAAVAVKAGDYFTFSGVDFAAGTVAEGATAACTAEKPAAPGGETVPVKNVNVALNKTSYTTSQLFRQNEQWSWGDDSPIAYPDEDGKTLTDGVFAPDEKHELYDASAGAWMGFHSQCPDYMENGYAWIKLDLGAAYDLTEVVLYTSSSQVSSAKAAKITVLVSADGETWNDFGEVEVVDDETKTVIKNSITGTANARYVQYKFTAVGHWLGVCEAEVYANVADTDSKPEVIVETITVDGDLSDNGWAADKWITVSGENGSWQYPTLKEVAAGTPIPTFTYKFQLRADDAKLYGALVLDGVHEEEKNIKVRIWFRDNDEATVYSSFYDFVFAPDGTLTTAAKYNTSTTENKGAAIEPTTLEAVAKIVDGKTVFEFSVDVTEVTKDGNFDYFVSLERKQGVNTGTLYFPFIPEKDEISPHGNYPWALWMAENDATVAVEDIVLGEIVAEGGEAGDDLGDAGIYAIAALAVVALIGTAIVIKKRA